MSTSNLDLLNPAVRGGVLWLLSEVLAVELNVFQVPSAGGGVFLAMALAAGTDGLAQKCTQEHFAIGAGCRQIEGPLHPATPQEVCVRRERR